MTADVRNRNELKEFLKAHLVPSRIYNLKGARNARICMEKAANGFDVFFSDHRQKVGLLHFATESEACRAMIGEIQKVMQVMYGLKFVA